MSIRLLHQKGHVNKMKILEIVAGLDVITDHGSRMLKVSAVQPWILGNQELLYFETNYRAGEWGRYF